MECFLELMHHDLEVLNVFNIEVGHVLLELRLLIVNLVLQFNNPLSQSQLRSNGTLERDTDANWELKIIKAEIRVVKPFINEVIQNIHIKGGRSLKISASSLLFMSISRASSPRSSSIERSMASFSFLKTAAGVSA